MQQGHTDDRSLGELFSDLAGEMSTLVKQELKLASTEMSQKASQVGIDIAWIAVGGLVAYAGFLAVIAGIVALLAANGMTVWGSALVVGLVIAGIGYMLLQRGLNALKQQELVPRRTVESLREDTQWAKEQLG